MSLEVKQKYLRAHIMEAGHDPQAFVDFCAQTHDLDDLENWSMNQLIDIVQRFKDQVKGHTPKKGHQEEDQFGGYQQAKSEIKQPTIKIQNPPPTPEFALKISDEDWKHFLSGPSIVQSTNKPSTGGSFDFPPDLLLGLGSGSAGKKVEKVPQKPKESSFSPPSVLQQKPDTLKKQDSFKVDDPKSGSIKIQKPEKGRKQGNAINLSNIKIPTGKEKIQPLLPQINDVVVKKTEQISPKNFLQSDYTLYHITFPPTQHVIKRKFSDFRKVRQILQKFYPFLRLPYLQPEGWLSSSQGKDPQTLEKYKWMIEQFVRYVLLKSKQFKDIELVRILCGFSLNGQKDDLKKKINSYQNIKQPKFIGQILLNQNFFLVPPVRSCDKIVQNTVNLVGQLDIHYQKLRRQIDNLFGIYDLLVKNYGDIVNTFDTLESLTQKYNFDNNQSKDVRIFEGMKEMTAKMAHRVDEQFGIFKNKIKNVFRYEKQNMTTIKQVFEGRNKIHNEYLKQGCPSFTSNSMRIQGANVEIESPVPLEDPVRNNKNTLALQEAFWSFIVSKEINRYWQYLRKKISEHLTYIAYDELDAQNQNLNFWNTMIKKCVI